MCGIFCMINSDESDCQHFYECHVQELLKNRGPDSTKSLWHEFGGQNCWLTATILSHQGSELSEQPVVDSDNVLLFNGDLFMDEIGDTQSDTEYLLSVLVLAAQTEEDFLAIFKRIVGPFSLICIFKNNLYFARDSLGRNSLLIGKNRDSIFLSSVINTRGNKNIKSVELPPLGVYKISDNHVQLFPYQELVHQYHFEQLDTLKEIVGQLEISKEVINPQWLQLKKDTSFSFSFDQLISEDSNPTILFDQLLSNCHVEAACNQFIELLSQSLKYRVERTKNECKTCVRLKERKNDTCTHANIAVLFSGGVDCSIIALLADKLVDKSKQIDLLNVAFEKASNKSEEIDFNVPDRLTGYATFDELKALSPERKYNFVEINVTRCELHAHVEKLKGLVYPLQNVLDESLGAALYFASRGRGCLSGENYQSNCRVILMGSGADELFGGYTRHRNAFKRSTSECDLLQQELDLDWIRLPSRNLARDDRVIGDNGVTVRAPYIEENFVNFARSLSALQRCYPKIAEGVGDKLLLRLSAYKLGLKGCCTFRKRALQFGSRIADKRQNAKDKSSLLC